MMRRPSLVLLTLVCFLAMSCEAHHRNRKRDRLSDVLRDDDDDGEKSGKSDDSDSGVSDDDTVPVDYRALPDAVVQTGLAGNPTARVRKLRAVLCEGRDSDPVIFYHLKVATHWHYVWLCSSPTARRISSRTGARKLKEWLDGFQERAASMATRCPPGSAGPLLEGKHDSGVNAVAYCNSQLVLQFPDGGEDRRALAGAAGQPAPAPYPPPPSYGAPPAAPAYGSCPPCPAGPACPPQQPCPVCPRVDCQKVVLEAGQKGFTQGVTKACRRICQLVYNQCRSLDSKTSLCYQISEFCAANCTK